MCVDAAYARIDRFVPLLAVPDGDVSEADAHRTLKVASGNRFFEAGRLLPTR